MTDLIPYYNQFSEKPQNYTQESLIKDLKAAHGFKRQIDARIAVFSGIRLILLKDEFKLHNKSWDDLYEDLGISQQTASNYINLARTFKEDPSCLDGIGVRKALAMVRYGEDEDIVKFKADGIWKGPDGIILTHSQLMEMTAHDFENKLLNLRNQKNKVISEWKNRALENDQEILAMKEEHKQKLKLIEDMQKNANETMHKEIKTRDNQLAKKDREINELERTIEERDGQLFDEIAVDEALVLARKALEEVIYKYNMLKPGYYPKLGQKLVSFFGWVRESMNARFFTGDKFLEPPEHEEKPDDNYDDDGYFEPPELQ